jgi:hypothetical protein
MRRMVERRLLMLSFRAPPEPAMGRLRWWSLSRHLAKRGWAVHMITAAPGASGEPVPADTVVEKAERPKTLQDRHRAVRKAQVVGRLRPPGGRCGISSHAVHDPEDEQGIPDTLRRVCPGTGRRRKAYRPFVVTPILQQRLKNCFTPWPPRGNSSTALRIHESW